MAPEHGNVREQDGADDDIEQTHGPKCRLSALLNARPDYVFVGQAAVGELSEGVLQNIFSSSNSWKGLPLLGLRRTSVIKATGSLRHLAGFEFVALRFCFAAIKDTPKINRPESLSCSGAFVGVPAV